MVCNTKLWFVQLSMQLRAYYVELHSSMFCFIWPVITDVCKYITYYLLHREDQDVSYGLNWAIAGRGVIVKDKVFHNLETSELQKGGATYPGTCKTILLWCVHKIDTNCATLCLHLEHADCLSGIPLHVRGDVIGGVPDVSKALFAKLLKLVRSKLWLQPSMWFSWIELK
jgi:hypothetical protein